MVLGLYNLIIQPYLCFSKHANFRHKVSLDYKSRLEGFNKLYDNVKIVNSSIGLFSYIGPGTFLMNCEVGRFCSIASGVKTILGRHPTRKFVSTHPVFYSLAKQSGITFVNKQKYQELKYINDKNISVKIGNDVWIGADVLIFDGVTIGDGAIIGARSVVNKSIEPYSIYSGNPITFIRKRFEDNEIDFLNRIKWWNKDITWIKKNCDLFANIKDFIKINM